MRSARLYLPLILLRLLGAPPPWLLFLTGLVGLLDLFVYLARSPGFAVKPYISYSEGDGRTDLEGCLLLSGPPFPLA